MASTAVSNKNNVDQRLKAVEVVTLLLLLLLMPYRATAVVLQGNSAAVQQQVSQRAKQSRTETESDL